MPMPPNFIVTSTANRKKLLIRVTLANNADAVLKVTVVFRQKLVLKTHQDPGSSRIPDASANTGFDVANAVLQGTPNELMSSF